MFDSILFLLGSFVLTAISCRMGIPILERLKMGQPIREDGPESHFAKSGVPTMGGIWMVIPILLISVLFFRNFNTWIIIAGMLAFGAVGFIDDYEKLLKKQSLGLNERQKLILQVSAAVVLVALFAWRGNLPMQYVPFVEGLMNWSIFIYPIAVFVLVGTVNATNITDGLDGLSSLVSVFVFLGYAVIAGLQGQFEVSAFAMSFAGALIAFLFFNANPAKVFMGDTGSMAFGGAVALLAIVTKTIWFLPIIGLIYVIEAGSVIIQTMYFRKTGGKRIFLMSPIHHHYELKGVPEQKIVIWFGMISLLSVSVALYLYAHTGGVLIK